MSELKNCPFCGGEAQLFEDVGQPFRFKVKCKECNAVHGGSAYENNDFNIKAWNTRPEPLRALNEGELESALREIRKPKSYYLDTNKEIAKAICSHFAIPNVVLPKGEK